MTDNTTQYTKYYQATLEDELITASALRGEFNFEISFDELQNGKLTKDITEKIFRRKKMQVFYVGAHHCTSTAST